MNDVALAVTGLIAAGVLAAIIAWHQAQIRWLRDDRDHLWTYLQLTNASLVLLAKHFGITLPTDDGDRPAKGR